jgi:hypothetical protein
MDMSCRMSKTKVIFIARLIIGPGRRGGGRMRQRAVLGKWWDVLRLVVVLLWLSWLLRGALHLLWLRYWVGVAVICP